MWGAAHRPLGCAASHTRVSPERFAEAAVTWGRVLTPGSGTAVGTRQALTPNLMQWRSWSQSPSGFPWGWCGACLLSKWRCTATHCPVLIVPLDCACTLLGDPGPQALVVVLLGRVGWQSTCPPGNGTALHRCHAHPKTALLGPAGGLHAPA